MMDIKKMVPTGIELRCAAYPKIVATEISSEEI